MRKLFLFSVACALLLSGCGTGLVQTGQSWANDPSRFTYTRIYCTPDQESHFENVTIELSKTNVVSPVPPLYVGGNRQVSSVLFLGAGAFWGTHDLKDRLNHPAPAAQFVAVLRGDLSITTTDGETRRFRSGDVVRVEDTAPCKGHISVWGENPGYLMLAR